MGVHGYIDKDTAIATPVSVPNGGTAQSTYTIGDILYASASDTLSKLPVGADGDFLAYSGNVPYTMNPSNTAFVFDHVFDNSLYTISSVGTGASVSTGDNPSEAGHPGIFQLQTGTTTTGGVSCYYGLDTSITLGGGEIVYYIGIKVPTLSTVGEEFIVRAGLLDAANNGSVTDGVYLEYDRLNSVNWRYAATDASTTTIASSSVAVSTNWITIKIVVNPAASSVEYFIDGVSLGTNATNIPSSKMGMGCQIVKSAGTTERVMDFDYVWFMQKLT